MKQLLLVFIIGAMLLGCSENGLASEQRVVKVPLDEWTAVAIKKGWLQEEFAKHGADVEAVTITVANTALPALFEHGDLQFSTRHLYPLLQTRINGFDATVVWQSVNVTPRCAVIVVLKDSPINTLADLKGKTLGTNRFGCPYFASEEALQAVGLKLDTDTAKGDVRFLNTFGNTSIPAFLAGKFDALALHPAYKNSATLYTQGLVKEISTALPGGIYLSGGGRTSIVVPRQWGHDNPDLVQAYLTVFAKTRLWILAHPDEAVPIIADGIRTTPDVAKFLITDSSSFTLLPGLASSADAVKTFQWFQAWAIKSSDDFFTKKSLTDKQLDDFVDKRFFEGGAYYVNTSGGENTPNKSAQADSAIQGQYQAVTSSR